MSARLTRRNLLRALAFAVGCLPPVLAGGLLRLPRLSAQSPEPRAAGAVLRLPLVFSRNAPSSSRVVHIHAPAATDWDFTTGWYWQHVSQSVLDQMVPAGLMRLTATPSVAEAWRVLIPAYRPGQKIAIKVNLNNARSNDPSLIDALIEPVNSLMTTLVAGGVREEDLWVYDAVRPMPASFFDRRRHKRARFFATSGADAVSTFNHADASLRVAFSHQSMVRERWLADLLFQASYLVNVPIIKRHGTHPVTLGFKNHFGSLSDLGGPSGDNPHDYINPASDHYRADYSPLVDINANHNIAAKTVLTVADGLFGAPWVGVKPVRWRTFGDAAPNSLFFSRDRVAMDCVLCDLLRAEWGLVDAAYDYLRVAQARGLGVCERGDPWGSGYQQIEYLKQAL